MRKVSYYHVGNYATFGRFRTRETKDAIESLRNLYTEPTSRLSVIHNDGLCMHLAIESFDRPEPKPAA